MQKDEREAKENESLNFPAENGETEKNEEEDPIHKYARDMHIFAEGIELFYSDLPYVLN